MNQFHLYRRFKTKFNLSLTICFILLNLNSVYASNIDDDLNYIGKAEDYDKVGFVF